MKRDTIFSPCRKYRYTLWREWDSTLPVCQFVGLNPSTADETNDDPTVRRCIGFAKSFGCGSLCMTNIFAWRDTLPENMKKAAEPIGVDNDRWLTAVSSEAKIVIAAWGKHGSHLYRGYKVKQLIPNLMCLAKNADRSPRHPLYLKKSLTPIPF